MPEVSAVDGVKIFYEVIGEGDVTLVFIGGWSVATGRKCWEYQLSLATKYRLVLIDLPGHGKSRKDRERYTMELYGQDVRKVIEKLDLNNLILIGWSMGGAVILEAELLLSDKTLGLIPVDSLIPFSTSSYIKQEEGYITNYTKPIRENFQLFFTNFYNYLRSDKLKPKDIVFSQEHIQSLDKRSMISAITELLRWNMYDILPKIKKPIRCIFPGKSINLKLREEINNFFDAIYLEGLKHLMHKEDPVSFNLALEKRINELLNL